MSGMGEICENIRAEKAGQKRTKWTKKGRATFKVHVWISLSSL